MKRFELGAAAVLRKELLKPLEFNRSGETEQKIIVKEKSLQYVGVCGLFSRCF